MAANGSMNGHGNGYGNANGHPRPPVNQANNGQQNPGGVWTITIPYGGTI